MKIHAPCHALLILFWPGSFQFDFQSKYEKVYLGIRSPSNIEKTKMMLEIEIYGMLSFFS